VNGCKNTSDLPVHCTIVFHESRSSSSPAFHSRSICLFCTIYNQATEGSGACVPTDVFEWLTTTFGGARGRTGEVDSDDESVCRDSECDGNGGDDAEGANAGTGADFEAAHSSSAGSRNPSSRRETNNFQTQPRQKGPLGLTPDGFLKAYAYMYTSSGGDPSTVWRDLRFLGYDVRPNR